MKKYIDAEKLIELFEQDDDLFKSQDIRHIVRKTSETEVVEIVLCKDCFIHGNCNSEDAFLNLGIEKPFCCLGGRKGKCADISE